MTLGTECGDNHHCCATFNGQHQINGQFFFSLKLGGLVWRAGEDLFTSLLLVYMCDRPLLQSSTRYSRKHGESTRLIARISLFLSLILDFLFAFLPKPSSQQSSVYLHNRQKVSASWYLEGQPHSCWVFLCVTSIFLFLFPVATVVLKKNLLWEAEVKLNDSKQRV